MSFRIVEALRKDTLNRFASAAMDTGEAFRITPQPTGDDGGFELDNGEQFILQIVPTESGGTLHLEAPIIDPEEKARIDIYENAEPNDEELHTNDDLFIHNQRYDKGMADKEVPDATIRRIDSGELNTTPADQTEHRVLREGREYAAEVTDRNIWRTVPFGDNISIVVEDRSGGNNNALDFSLVLFEGDRLPQ